MANKFRNSNLVAERLVGDHRLTEVFYRGGLRQARHRHSLPALSFVASGRYEESFGRHAYSRSTATVVFHPADECHSVSFESDVSIVAIEFRGDEVNRSADESLTRSSSHRSELLNWLGTRLRREMQQIDDASRLSIDGIVSEMLAEGARAPVVTQKSSSAPWLSRAIDYIHDNFATTPSLDDVAMIAGVHPAHLSRVFRQRMHCTVGEYLRRLRFEFACNRILSTEQPLCDVAHEAGFADQSHFHRLFRRHMGITPFAYRRIYRG
jgi:AraC family transcriptional regulator